MFEKFNKGYARTVKEGLDTSDWKYKKLKECVGETIHVQGFFFTKGRFGNCLVVVGDNILINMPERAVTMFEEIRSTPEMLKAVLDGHLMITNIAPKEAKNGNTVTFDLVDC